MDAGKERKRKRLFATAILTLMVILAAGVAVFAQGTTSYTLKIAKRIDKEGLPNEIYDQARNQEYVFRIDGFGHDNESLKSVLADPSLGKGVEAVDGNDNALLVTIQGGEEQVLSFNTPVAVTVSEVTNGLKFQDDDGYEWSMGTAECESTMPAKIVEGSNGGTGSARDLTINIGKPGGKIMISKENDAENVSYFRLTRKPQTRGGGVEWEFCYRGIQFRPDRESRGPAFC